MHTGVFSSGVVGHVCFERYTRVLMEASLEFPIHFLKIYSVWEAAHVAGIVRDARMALKGDAPPVE